MEGRIGQVSLLVRDYDEALEFFVSKLGFIKVEDTRLSAEKRWVVIRPVNGGEGCDLLLAKAGNEHQQSFIGNQSGGRVWLFLYTKDIEKDLDVLKRHDVRIVHPLREEAYGKVLVFADLYGNLWDLIERN